MESINDQELFFLGQLKVDRLLLLHGLVGQRMHLGQRLFKPLFKLIAA